MKNNSRKSLMQGNIKDLILSELWRNGLKKKTFKMYAFGDSMLPFFKDNVLLKLKPTSDIQLGNIVYYLDKNNRLICHRVVKIKNEEIVTKGDNNLQLDQPIIKSQILGKILQDGTTSSVSEIYINRIIAMYSLIQAKIYAMLINNPLAITYCRIMEKHLKTPYFTLAYKEMSKLFISPVLLFSSKSRDVKLDNKKEVIYVYNSAKVVNWYFSDANNGFLKNEEKLINRYFKNKSRALVLGCAAGREAISLAKLGNSVTAIDLADNMLKKAKQNAKRENLNIKFLKADVINLPFKAKNFDYVTLLNVSEYLQKKERIKTLRECNRVLTKHGLLLYSTYPTIIKTSKEEIFNRSILNLKRNIMKKILGGKYTGIESNDSMQKHPLFPRPLLTHSFTIKETLREISEGGFEVLDKCTDYEFNPLRKFHLAFYVLKKD